MSGNEGPHSADARFARIDEMPDEMFYGMPRLVTHIDDEACSALAAYYDRILKDDDRILDLMSSCVSHLPNPEVAVRRRCLRCLSYRGIDPIPDRPGGRLHGRGARSENGRFRSGIVFKPDVPDQGDCRMAGGGR